MQEQRPILLTYSSVWSHRVLESIAEPYAQRVVNECARSGYIIVSPCEKLCLNLPSSADTPDEATEQAHPCAQIFKQMNDTFKQATNYAWMPLYEKTIVHQNNHLELHTYLKAIVIFNYKHRLNIREAGTQDDLEGMYQLGEEIAKLFTPAAKVLRPSTTEELYASYADCYLNSKPDCSATSWRISTKRRAACVLAASLRATNY